jgi:prolyl-tRNA synthetase
VPIRIEVGPRDVDAGTVVLARRDRNRDEAGQRQSVRTGELEPAVRQLLDEIGESLYRQAKSFLAGHTFATTDRDAFFELCRTRAGMIDIAWCERAECEAEIKRVTTATTRVLRDLQATDVRCVACGEPAKARAYFAQSY